jgi:RNA polymerase primary sigma factor
LQAAPACVKMSRQGHKKEKRTGSGDLTGHPSDSFMNVQGIRDDVTRLLRHFNGLDTIKRLFWETLGYERVQEPFPSRLLPDALKGQVLDASLLAEHEGFFIIHVHCSGQALDPKLERQTVRKASKRFPFAAFVFTNRVHDQWDFLYPLGGCKLLALFPGGEAFWGERTARLLARLSALDDADRSLSLLELTANYEQVFGKAGLDWRGKRVEESLTPWAMYLAVLGRYPTLTHLEEAGLIEDVEACGFVMRGEKRRRRLVPPERRGAFLYARDRLVLGNLRLSVWLAKKLQMQFRTCHLELQDLAQEGVLGLIRAVELIEKRFGTRFATYATPWILQTVRRAIFNTERLIRLPVHRGESGDHPELGRFPCILSLDHRAMSAHRALIDPSGQVSDLNELARERNAAVRAALKCLPARSAAVLERRFGFDGREPETLEELGCHFGITRERVRQIEMKALDRLKQRLLESAHFEEFKEQPNDRVPRRRTGRSRRSPRGPSSPSPEHVANGPAGARIPVPAGVSAVDRGADSPVRSATPNGEHDPFSVAGTIGPGEL